MSKTRPKTMPTASATDDLIAQDAAERPALSADKLEAITAAAGQLLELEGQAAELEDKLAILNGEGIRLKQEVLPALMDEAGVTSLRLDDDTTLSRDDAVFASIAKADANTASEWLIANGYASIVKMAFAIPVDKGDVKLQKQIRALLAKARIGYEEQSSVHPGTLRSFAKESVEAGRKLPPEIKVHVQPTVKVARKKVK